MPPLKLQVIMKNVVLFWLLDITYLCLHYNYICLRFCLSQKNTKTDDSSILKFIFKNLELWVTKKIKQVGTHAPNPTIVCSNPMKLGK
jgi:hypothetical protein